MTETSVGPSTEEIRLAGVSARGMTGGIATGPVDVEGPVTWGFALPAPY
jgi:hypothetical protein